MWVTLVSGQNRPDRISTGTVVGPGSSNTMSKKANRQGKKGHQAGSMNWSQNHRHELCQSRVNNRDAAGALLTGRTASIVRQRGELQDRMLPGGFAEQPVFMANFKS
jgi:hypothetical protein